MSNSEEIRKKLAQTRDRMLPLGMLTSSSGKKEYSNKLPSDMYSKGTQTDTEITKQSTQQDY